MNTGNTWQEQTDGNQNQWEHDTWGNRNIFQLEFNLFGSVYVVFVHASFNIHENMNVKNLKQIRSLKPVLFT